MIVLLASICFSSILAFIFKLFERYDVDTLPAIVFNYLTCYVAGSIMLGESPLFDVTHEPWFPYALFLGLVFILGFNIVAATVQQYGITVATLMQKMSLILTVIFAIIFFSESSGILKILGLFLAIISIYLINQPKNRISTTIQVLGLLPILTWLISGVIEITLLYVQRTNLIVATDPRFVTVLFGFAGILGLLYIILSSSKRMKLFKQKNILWGVILGVPNFFSIYYLIRVLDLPWDGSVLFPINNVGIMIFSAIGAVLIFKEQLSIPQRIGLVSACAAIVILTGLV